MPNKNILVIGGAGYIGSHMVKLLLEREYRVTPDTGMPSWATWPIKPNSTHSSAKVIRPGWLPTALPVPYTPND
ncbi:MAG: NAD-dependent epimerase/dehydratase family protein [Hydrogenophilales bacterium]|nr:NAD-dependent epimerase/dehydratase family protein [Hydrogenophilales bacterium]